MSQLALTCLLFKRKEKKKKNNIQNLKEKKKKRKEILNNDLAVLPSHDIQDPRQRDACHHLCTRRVEAFPGRSLTPSGDLDRPQELGVLHDS